MNAGIKDRMVLQWSLSSINYDIMFVSSKEEERKSRRMRRLERSDAAMRGDARREPSLGASDANANVLLNRSWL